MPPRLRTTIAFFTATRLVMNTAFRFVYPFLPAISRGLGISLTEGGLLVSARSLAGAATPAIVASAGRGDRHRRALLAALILFVLGAALTAATGVLIGAFVGFVLIGFAKPVFDVSAQAYLAERTPYERRARVLSILELTWSGALLLGAPAAGWLIGRFGWQAPFWALAGCGGAALASLLWTVEPDRPHSHGGRQRIRLGRSAVSLLAVAFLFSLAAEITLVVFGAWLEDRFSLSLVALGGSAAVLAAAELAGEGGTLVFADRVGKRRMVAGGLALSTVAFIAIAPLSSSLGPGMAVLAVAFFGFEITIVSSIPLATEAAPASRAAYLALLVTSISLARAVGSALGPMIFTTGGLGANALTSAGLDVGALLLLWWGVHEEP